MLRLLCLLMIFTSSCEGQIMQNASDKHGQLSVKGNQIVDKDGNAIQLKGVSSHGLQWFGNIVTKEKVADLAHPVARAMLQEPSEQALFAALSEVQPAVQARMERNEFAEALQALARLRDPIDRFFTDVRVVVPDEALRANRFALLNQLNHLLNRVANISRLPA